MDKYLDFALRNTKYIIFDDEQLTHKTSDKNWTSSENGIIVKQNDDYNVTKYYICFYADIFNSITFNGKEYGITTEFKGIPSIVVPVDFNYKINDAIFDYNVLGPSKVEIKYIDADKKAFDDKMAKENQDKLAETALIKISTGADLVNIYFQPCCEAYAKTTIELYLANGTYTQPPMVMGKHDIFHPQLVSATPDQMIGKFDVDQGMLFKSITGLARHAYAVKVSQFDNKGKLLFVTDYKYFNIG